jgi:hypothetical protein
MCTHRQILKQWCCHADVGLYHDVAGDGLHRRSEVGTLHEDSMFHFLMLRPLNMRTDGAKPPRAMFICQVCHLFG